MMPMGPVRACIRALFIAGPSSVLSIVSFSVFSSSIAGIARALVLGSTNARNLATASWK